MLSYMNKERLNRNKKSTIEKLEKFLVPLHFKNILISFFMGIIPVCIFFWMNTLEPVITKMKQYSVEEKIIMQKQANLLLNDIGNYAFVILIEMVILFGMSSIFIGYIILTIIKFVKIKLK